MNEKIELINAWIEKADHDLGSAKVIFINLPEYFDTIAFHCQQAVEKYIKAALVFYDIQTPKSHDLIYLFELLSTQINVEENHYQDAITLNGYSVIIRYPNQTINLSKTEIVKAINIAEGLRSFIVSLIDIS